MTPLFDIGPETLRLVPQEAGAIDAAALRRPVATLRDQSHRIIEALDAVISGV
jgi:hypothetical protein